ncbi:MAG: 16S rRNA processing protein RimM [Alphaproteobacteria bacterium]|nr:16S rRNA processing protein RimM [Alphaproteobacteria bacterium]
MNVSDFVELAVVTSPHGVSGRVKIKSFASPPESFALPNLIDAAGNPVRLKITGGDGTVFIAAIEGLKRREDAELWRGKKLGVPRAALPDTRKEGEFFVTDLIGIPVTWENGDAYGTIKAVYNFGAGDILEITKRDGSDEMFSFNTATFPTIDVAAKRIVISPPEVIRGEEHD